MAGGSAQFQGNVDLTENLSSGVSSPINATYGGIYFGDDDKASGGEQSSVLLKAGLIAAVLIIAFTYAKRRQ